MTDYKMTEVEENPYFYIDGKCASDPDVISQSMGKAFCDVMAFMEKKAVAPAGPPLSVYYTHDPDEMSYRAGIFVSKTDLEKAAGDIKAATTPSGRVLTLTHVGPYRELRNTYENVMSYLKEQNLAPGAPTWEVYVDDPEKTPEESLRTEIFMSLA